MRYQAVERLAGEHPVRRLCRALGAAPSGYYRWQRRVETERARDGRLLKQKILAIHGKTKGRYDAPRVARALRRQGAVTSRRRVGRLRRELELRAKAAKKFKATTDWAHPHSVGPNRLQRCFDAPAADRVSVGDITYLRTQESWLYLAVVLDTYSDRIVGWSVSDRCGRRSTTSPCSPPTPTGTSSCAGAAPYRARRSGSSSTTARTRPGRSSSPRSTKSSAGPAPRCRSTAPKSPGERAGGDEGPPARLRSGTRAQTVVQLSTQRSKSVSQAIRQGFREQIR